MLKLNLLKRRFNKLRLSYSTSTTKFLFSVGLLFLVVFFLFSYFSKDEKAAFSDQFESNSGSEEVIEKDEEPEEIRLVGRKKIIKIDEWDWGDLPDEGDYKLNISALKSLPFIVAEAGTDPPLKLVIPWWDPQVLQIIQVGGRYQETTEMKHSRELLSLIASKNPKHQRSGSLIVDVGAQLGMFSLIAASLGYRTIAYEANPYHLEKFQMSISLNGFEDRITIVEALVTDEIGDTEIATPNDGSLGFYSGRHVHEEMKEAGYTWKEVQMVRADYSVEWLNLMDDIQLLRISAAGQEFKVLQGASHLFIKNRVRAILLTFWPEGILRHQEDPMTILLHLSDLGFVLAKTEDSYFNRQQEFQRLVELSSPTELYWVRETIE